MGSAPRKHWDHVHVADRNDLRRGSEQFHHLPHEAQDEFEERWRAEVERQLEREELRRRFFKRSVVEGALLFAMLNIVFDVASFWSVITAFVVGAGTGALWYQLRAKRFLCIFLSLPGYFIVRAVSGMPDPFTLLFGAVAFLAVIAAAGTIREFRRGDHSVM